MKIEEALVIVYQLAKDNALEPETSDECQIGEALKQQDALNIVHDLIVNQYGED